MGKRIRISSESLNCYGTWVKTDGVDLEQYQRNPVLLWMHWRGMVVGCIKDLRVEGTDITGEPFFEDYMGLNNDPDEIDWCEIKHISPCCEWDWLQDIRICYATHNLCVLKPYSVPDALLLNDFWCEVKVTYQHITDLNGF